MKKFLSFVLALALCLGLTASVLAADAASVEVVPCKYDMVGDFSEGLAYVIKQGYVGYVDKTGKEIVPPDKYVDIDSMAVSTYTFFYKRNFSNGLAMVAIDTGLRDSMGNFIPYYGFIDKTGKEVVPCKYRWVAGFSDGLAAVGGYDDGRAKYGFVDTTGTEVIPCQYSSVSYYGFSEGLAAVILDGGWGYIDTAGREVIPGKYAEARDFSEGLAAVRTGSIGSSSYLDSKYGKWGYIDKTGKEVIPCKYDYCAGEFSEGFAVVAQTVDDEGRVRYGLIDKTGKEVVPCKYESMENFSEGVAQITVGIAHQKYGYIDATGNEIVPPGKYDSFGSFSEGLAWVELDGKYGYVDKTGKEVIPCKYQNVGDFSEGLAGVRLEGHTLVIDKTGKEVFSSDNWNLSGTFSKGFALVHNDKGYGFIDNTGREVVPCKYDEISDSHYIGQVGGIHDGLAAVKLDGKWGFVSVNGAASSTPTTPTTPAGIPLQESGTAYESTQTVTVDGKAVQFQMYALKSEEGGLSNYIKLRDLATALDGTKAQFNVTWSKAAGVGVETGKAYTSRNGSENKTLYSGDMPYKKSASTTGVNGTATALQTFAITDPSTGGDATYYQLRDLGRALGFNVGWSYEQGVFIETDKPYTDAD